jgi:hypothetical protein
VGAKKKTSLNLLVFNSSMPIDSEKDLFNNKPSGCSLCPENWQRELFVQLRFRSDYLHVSKLYPLLAAGKVPQMFPRSNFLSDRKTFVTFSSCKMFCQKPG